VLRAEHRIIGKRTVVDNGIGAAVQQRDIAQAQVNVGRHGKLGPARCLEGIGEAAADVLMQATRGSAHDDGSVNDLDPTADVRRQRLVVLGAQPARRQIHPVRQGSHRNLPSLCLRPA